MKPNDEAFCAATGYSLIADDVDGTAFFGVCVAARTRGGIERAELRELTSDRALAERILEAMRRGGVTPCAAAGVADDLLAEDVLAKDRLAGDRLAGDRLAEDALTNDPLANGALK